MPRLPAQGAKVNYNGKRVPGCDYSFNAADKLPELIGSQPMTARDISVEIGRNHKSIDHMIKKLHEQGKVHIASWKRGMQGPIAAMYQWGPGQDAKRPKPLTASQKCKRYRQSGPSQSAKQQRIARQGVKSGGLAAIDPLLAAIMGQSINQKKEQPCI